MSTIIPEKKIFILSTDDVIKLARTHVILPCLLSWNLTEHDF